MDIKSIKSNALRFSVTGLAVTGLTALLLGPGAQWSKLQTVLWQIEIKSYAAENSVENLQWYLGQEGYFYQMSNLLSTVCFVLAAVAVAAGFLLALPRVLAIGRGFWGKLPLEVHLLVGSILFSLCPLAGSVEMDGAFTIWNQSGMVDTISRITLLDVGTSQMLALGLVAAAIWCGLFLLFQAGASLGMGVRDGFGRYLRCRCLCVRMVAGTLEGCNSLMRKLLAIDLHQPLEANLFRILLLNCVLVVLFCSTWFFGIAGAIIYSVVLFFLLRRYFGKLKISYDALLDGAARMADGNLSQPLEGEMGLLNELRDEMNEVQRGFARAVEEEVRSRNMKTELITNVSHDLKTPLTAIITYVDLLRDPNLDPATRQSYVETLDRKSQRLKRLIEDLFEVSKAASGNVVLEMQPMDLTALLKQVQFELEDTTAASGVDFRWNLPAEKVPVVLDGQRSCRIFENLIGNIVKYAMPGTRAYITLWVEDGMAVTELKNISATELPEDAARLTQRFVRGDAARSTEGSGLGLAIAKSFTELQQGSFVLETDGDLFRAKISFPVREEQPAEQAEAN